MVDDLRCSCLLRRRPSWLSGLLIGRVRVCSVAATFDGHPARSKATRSRKSGRLCGERRLPSPARPQADVARARKDSTRHSFLLPAEGLDVYTPLTTAEAVSLSSGRLLIRIPAWPEASPPMHSLSRSALVLLSATLSTSALLAQAAGSLSPAAQPQTGATTAQVPAPGAAA